jgi:hypothetical protein
MKLNEPCDLRFTCPYASFSAPGLRYRLTFCSPSAVSDRNFLLPCSSTMDRKRVIDAQFDRAVEMVQGLPKTGPIQTSYDAKLTMYRCEILPSEPVSRFE